MAIELSEPPPEPSWPAGLEPRSFDREHAEAFHDATEDAFADEWRHEPEPFDDWRRRRLDDPGASPDLWLAVHDQDEIAATLICDEHRYEMGWIASLPDEKRLPLLDEVRSLLTAHEYRLPWQTHVHWSRLAEPPRSGQLSLPSRERGRDICRVSAPQGSS